MQMTNNNGWFRSGLLSTSIMPGKVFTWTRTLNKHRATTLLLHLLSSDYSDYGCEYLLLSVGLSNQHQLDFKWAWQGCQELTQHLHPLDPRTQQVRLNIPPAPKTAWVTCFRTLTWPKYTMHLWNEGFLKGKSHPNLLGPIWYKEKSWINCAEPHFGRAESSSPTTARRITARPVE